MIANAWSAVLTSMGVDVRQYRLLVGLLRQLSERRELTGQLGLDRRAFNITRGVFGFFGLILCAFVLAGVSAAFFLTMTTAATMMFLVSILVSDAADAFMNPAEAFVLAHQPIDSRSYIAAKTAYILSAAARIAVPAERGTGARGPRAARHTMVLSGNASGIRASRRRSDGAADLRSVWRAVPRRADRQASRGGHVDADRDGDRNPGRLAATAIRAGST